MSIKFFVIVNRHKTTDMTAIKKHQAKEPTRFNNIKKSPNDKRDYRGLILPNKMKVLLISDPTTDKSAASLDVNVGKSQKTLLLKILNPTL